MIVYVLYVYIYINALITQISYSYNTIYLLEHIIVIFICNMKF